MGKDVPEQHAGNAHRVDDSIRAGRHAKCRLAAAHLVLHGYICYLGVVRDGSRHQHERHKLQNYPVSYIGENRHLPSCLLTVCEKMRFAKNDPYVMTEYIDTWTHMVCF
jgi:hypothetical protein